MTETIEDIEIDRIFLYEENPRHEPLQSQDEIIEHLCRDEQVPELAEHISQEGTNPLELVGLVARAESGKRGTKKTYEVWEGNRRICAIKLLNDPDLAPARLRPRFEQLASGYTSIKRVKGVVFDNHDRLKFWMHNIHAGEQGGVGRKRWDSRQKARSTGSSKDAIALAILDLAVQLKIITKEQSKGRLTTVTRYVEKAPMKEVLGLDTDDLSNIKTDRTDDDFKAMLRTFFDDLMTRKIGSRDNLREIRPYARRLPSKAAATNERVAPRKIEEIAGGGLKRQPPAKPKAKPKKPKGHSRLIVSEDLLEALDQNGNDKLKRFYWSICEISVVDHTLLVAVGAWAFIETLTAQVGRKEGTSFLHFYSNHRLEQHGYAKGRERGVVTAALKRLSEGGNTTKHHALAATYDAGQLVNDMEVVTPLLIRTLKNGS